MIIYNREEKVVIIPEGDGTIVGGRRNPCEKAIEEAFQEGFQSGITADCGEAIEQARAEQYAEDVSKLEYGEITDNGFFWPKSGFGFSVVNVNVPQEYINCVEVLMVADNMPEYSTSRFNVSEIYVNGHRAGNDGVRTALVTGDRGIGFNLKTNETEVRTLSCVYTFYNEPLGADFPRDLDTTFFLGCDWTTGGVYDCECTVTELLAQQNYYKYRVDCEYTGTYYKFPDPCKDAINSAFQSGYTAGYQAGLAACQNNENQ